MEPYEPIAKYRLTENFDNVIKTVEFETNELTEVFSQMMGFMIYCGVSKESIYQMFDDYEAGFI